MAMVILELKLTSLARNKLSIAMDTVLTAMSMQGLVHNERWTSGDGAEMTRILHLIRNLEERQTLVQAD